MDDEKFDPSEGFDPAINKNGPPDFRMKPRQKGEACNGCRYYDGPRDAPSARCLRWPQADPEKYAGHPEQVREAHDELDHSSSPFAFVARHPHELAHTPGTEWCRQYEPRNDE